VGYGALRIDDLAPDSTSSANHERVVGTRTPAPHIPTHNLSTVTRSLDGAFEVFREFVEHIVIRNDLERPEQVRNCLRTFEWRAIHCAVADTSSLEQALGRAVVFAGRMHQKPIADTSGDMSQRVFSDDEPFFAFSVANALPDFGDQSRYRTRVTKRVVGLFRPRLVLATMALSSVSTAIFCLALSGHSAG
jgi:hypothetical protein